jgi:hypothetical protein
MKKSLSLLLAFALVFSMFSSLALAADELTTEEKYDAVGIFAGINGERALDQPMTRAQAARVTALLLKLDGIGDPDTKVVTEKPFTDVELGTWYVEEIAAVKEAGLFVGKPDGSFGPNDNITVQELAVVLVNILGLEPVEGAEVEGAAAWAAPYIKALQDNGIDFPTNYTDNALRRDLVEATYTAAVKLGLLEDAAGELAVTSVAQSGAKKITVKFNKAVDADAVKFSVKKGAANVAIADEDGYTWSTDKKSVVIKTDSRLSEGKYTVTVTDKDNKEVGKQEFEGQDEKIEKVEILTASDTIAKSDKNVIKFRGVNQFGEDSDLAASQYTVVKGHNDAIATPDSSEPKVTLDVSHANIVKDTRVPLTIIAPNGTAQDTKVFVVGDPPQTAKVEFGELKLAEDKTRLTAGDDATLELTAYDQYGNEIVDNTVLTQTTTRIFNRSDVIDSVDIDGDGNLEIKTKSGISNDTDVVITIVANGSGQSFNYNVKVYAAQQPADVEFGEFSDVISESDGTVYLPIIVYDQFGEKMAASDVAAAADKFTVFSNNSNVVPNVSIETTPGNNQGKVKVTVGSKGNATITLLVNATQKQKQYTVSVQEERVPNALVIDEAPATKLLPNAETVAKLKVKDQYGKDWKGNHADYKIVAELNNNYVTSVDIPANPTTITDEGSLTDGASRQTFTLTAGTTTGKTKMTIKLVKVDTSVTPNKETTISTISREFEVIAADKANSLTYEVKQLGKLFAVGKAGATLSDREDKNAKEVTVEAKDSNGVKVALPTVTMSVYSSDNAVAEPVGNKVVGKDGGTVTLTVTFTLAGIDGLEKVATQTVTVEEVLPYAEELTVANESKANERANVNGNKVYDGEVLGDIVMKDQYGIEYKNEDLFNGAYTDHKVKFTFTTTDGSGQVTIDGDGTLNVPTTVKAFTITVTSMTNGKSVEAKVTLTD